MSDRARISSCVKLRLLATNEGRACCAECRGQRPQRRRCKGKALTHTRDAVAVRATAERRERSWAACSWTHVERRALRSETRVRGCRSPSSPLRRSRAPERVWRRPNGPCARVRVRTERRPSITGASGRHPVAAQRLWRGRRVAVSCHLSLTLWPRRSGASSSAARV